MSDLERIEADGYGVYCTLAGGTVTRVRGGVCLSAPVPIVELNRVTDVRADLDLDAVTESYGGREHHVSVPPSCAALTEPLAARGYTPGYAWMKFERGAEPPPHRPTTLRITDAADPKLFGAIAAEGFDTPPEAAAAFDVLDRPGWHCFLAWDGEEPAAAASLYVDGDLAWLAGASTRPAFRGRGAQSALLAARIDKARDLGVTRMMTETGERLEGRPDQSYRNILRAGFREAYRRPNWRSPH